MGNMYHEFIIQSRGHCLGCNTVDGDECVCGHLPEVCVVCKLPVEAHCGFAEGNCPKVDRTGHHMSITHGPGCTGTAIECGVSVDLIGLVGI